MTQDQATPTDADNMQRLGAACRARLAQDPCDMAARLTLSWELFFQAIRQKHEQAIWSSLLAGSERQSESLRDALRSLKAETTRPSPDARRLFRDSLMHASMVIQLSTDPQQRQEAAKILELAGTLGESEVVAEVNEEANRILLRIARAIYAEKREKTRIPHRYRDDEDLDW